MSFFDDFESGAKIGIAFMIACVIVPVIIIYAEAVFHAEGCTEWEDISLEKDIVIPMG